MSVINWNNNQDNCVLCDIGRMDYHRKRRTKSERDKQRHADASTKVLLYLLAKLIGGVHLVLGLLADNSFSHAIV